ncbi:MAG: phosphatidate cytidylyltransferase [Vicinamibacterales bacterium]
MTAFVAIGAALASWRGGNDAVATASAALLPAFYFGCRWVPARGPREPWTAALFLLLLTMIVSDSAQYFVGRAFGRRKLAEVISPKKTLEGALGGFVFGTPLMVMARRVVAAGGPGALARCWASRLSRSASSAISSSRCSSGARG